MRLAFISDLHGNLQALDRVLEDIGKANVDQTICLGDVASLGPQPREVVERLQALQIPMIMGNHDMYLLDLQMTVDHHPWLRAVEQWCRMQLTQENLDFLGTFQPQISMSLDENITALCYHGSPRSNEEFIYPSTPSDTLKEMFATQTAQIFVGGHTHVQMLQQYKGGLIINPGSVGMPIEKPTIGQTPRSLPWAEYAILESINDKLTTHFYRLPIDFVDLAQTARASGLPDVEFWLSTWIV